MRTVKLNNGVEMPVLGFGAMIDPAQTEQAVSDALATGYRMIDSATVYMNEDATGAAISKSGISRQELFITSKLWPQDYGYENAKKGFETTLKKLGLDYLDLYLIHQPVGDYYGAWRALEELYDEGKIRAIGVSNFSPSRLVDLCMTARIRPAINQVETNPYRQQSAAMPWASEFGVQMEAWSPFAQGRDNLFQNELLSSIGAKYGKNVSQVILRWLLQRNVVAIPRTVHKERMAENLNIFDFQLSDADMEEIASLDRGQDELAESYGPEMVKMMHSMKLPI